MTAETPTYGTIIKRAIINGQMIRLLPEWNRLDKEDPGLGWLWSANAEEQLTAVVDGLIEQQTHELRTENQKLRTQLVKTTEMLEKLIGDR